MFKDNVIIITGASCGIGRELAYQLAEQGAWLALAARNEERLNEVAAKCQALGGKAIAVPTDVIQEEACQRLVERTVAEYGRVDTLINNAGMGIRGEFEELKDLKNFHYLMDVNFYGAVYCTRYALPHIIKTKGRIVGVSSLLGKFATKGNTAYCASKYAMAGFFDSLRLELMEAKVSVTMIYPGYIPTEFMERMVRVDGRPLGKTAATGIMINHAMKVDKAAKIIIKATARRKRQVIMTFYGVIATWLNQLCPSLLDRIMVLVRKIYKGSLLD